MLVLGGTLAVPRTLRAQQKAMPVIGFCRSFGRGPASVLIHTVRSAVISRTSCVFHAIGSRRFKCEGITDFTSPPLYG